jgi:PncC family amidohydrolase
MLDRLESLARDVASTAVRQNERIVLAESCTAGLVAQLLSRIPGASRWLCGSAVVYRNETKSAWLGIDPRMLADPEIGPVSVTTARAMCRGVLERTPEATLAASVTGHLGPQAPPELDGRVCIACASRDPAGDESGVDVFEHRLANTIPDQSAFVDLRLYRQHAAAVCVLEHVLERLKPGLE